MKLKEIVSFETIEKCVAYLVELGCMWEALENHLLKNHSFTHGGVIVLFDPYGILEEVGA